MDKSKALDKIKKLLALSKSDKEGEARNALVAAQRLMAEFGWKEEDVVLEEDVISEAFETSTKGVSPNLSQTLVTLAPHFRVCILRRKLGRQATLEVFGEKNDVKAFIEISKYILKAQEKAAKDYLKTKSTFSRGESIRIKNDFCQGFRNGCVKALEKNENDNQLMVIVPNAVVQAVESRATGTYIPSIGSAMDAEATIKGFFRGKEAIERRSLSV